MIRSLSLAVLLALSAAQLSGCGWHLRGQLNLPDNLRSVHLQGVGISSSQLRDFEQAFTLNKINLVDQAEAAYTVQLFNLEKERRVNSLGTDAVADSIALSLSADYAIFDQQGQAVIARGPAKVSRNFNFDRDNLAAKNQEEKIIEAELRRELAQQILRSFRFALKQQSKASAPATNTPAASEQPAVKQEQLDEQAAPGAPE